MEHRSRSSPARPRTSQVAGIANPVGQISTAALMLDFLGETKAAADINQAVDEVLRDGPRTPDLGGRDGTRDTADAIREQLR